MGENQENSESYQPWAAYSDIIHETQTGMVGPDFIRPISSNAWDHA
jgi:hypothetical protein